MYRINGLSRRNVNRNIKARVDEHMKDISNSGDFNVLSNSQGLARKRIKVTDDNLNQSVEQSPCLGLNFSESDTSDFNILSDSYSTSSEIEESILIIPDKSTYDMDLQKQLSACFMKHNTTHALINDLLHILKPHYALPNDARILLKTPQSTFVKKICGGDFVYFGLRPAIKEKIKGGLVENAMILDLSFNIDGLPLYKSSNKQFWTILCKIDQTLDGRPFPVAIFCGSSKPTNVKEFLSDFIDELASLADGQSDIGYQINVKSFICDSPARSFVKCIKNHNGYFGCERCWQKGKWFSRMTFQDCNSPKRKDSDFLKFSDDDDNEHIRDKLPLLKLNLGLITQFPLDYMHLVCLGVMRKLLVSWIRGPLGIRLCSRDIDILSNNLISFAKYIPNELPRKPRSLREVDRWKATEFRMFLLYLGPIVLKNLLSHDCYAHFLSLHIAIRILSNKVCIAEHLPYARQLLLNFVKKGRSLYGPEFLVYNVHNLIHLGDDVEKYGPLDSFSSFPFENYLGQLKGLLRTPNKPLQQIYRRILEMKESNNINIGENIPEFRVVSAS
ncbi:hypothetical protein HNY73_010152 [Argiope bruennichi]|uniref:Transposase domain-containing protein n=1 Tax=Argiope bruennichi TaxID=94029 RepID=A0A8T0F2F8_ARGBR|nr:hypothetical protein HNY73_010152 [Argiope bruennichi]